LNARKNIFLILFIVLCIFLGFYIRFDYYVIMPSRAVDLSTLIKLENPDSDDQGSFYLVTVTQQRAGLFTLVLGYLHPHMNINPAVRVIPPGMDESEYRQYLADIMMESRDIAKIVALREVGYDVDIISDGVEIIGLLEEAPAEGLLEEGDRIISVDGNAVFLATEVPPMVQDRRIGEEVSLEIIRNDQVVELSIKTGANPEDLYVPYLGIVIKSLPWEPILPIDIDIDTGRIGGPSAGLMLTLEIMNQYLPEDLAAGKKIAGTGTIDLNGNVGRIGGTEQKVIAAERIGADYFLVPERNYYQARNVARSVEVVKVTNIEDVLDFLKTLQQ
jgi:Lon-like protease